MQYCDRQAGSGHKDVGRARCGLPVVRCGRPCAQQAEYQQEGSEPDVERDSAPPVGHFPTISPTECVVVSAALYQMYGDLRSSDAARTRTTATRLTATVVCMSHQIVTSTTDHRPGRRVVIQLS
jgi:hypothetical protein